MSKKKSIIMKIICIPKVCFILFFMCIMQFAVGQYSYNVAVNSWGDYNFTDKTFYIESSNESVSSSDLEFREYADYLIEDLKLLGAKITRDKQNADMCILMNYSIADKSYVEIVPVPIIGKTGISSINTISNTRGSAYGSIYSSGNYTYGSVYGSSTTNSRTQVNYNYGVIGYNNIPVRRTQFDRVVNIYAYDNKDTSSQPTMLWKINLFSSGTSNDIREVVPYIMYIAWYKLGKNTTGWEGYSVFARDYLFLCWKSGYLSKPTCTLFPDYYKRTEISRVMRIVFVQKLNNETIICLKKQLSSIRYAISPYTYIQYKEKRVKISHIDNYKLGTKIKQEYIIMHFPARLDNVNLFDLIEYTSAKGNNYSFEWRGIKTK